MTIVVFEFMKVDDKQYIEHKVFEELALYSNFYRQWSFSIMHWVPVGTTAIMNIDTYVYSSIHETLESIKDLLIKGRINDSYSLLRKYYDGTLINVYVNLVLEEGFNYENFIIPQIENWKNGTAQLHSSKITKYVEDASKLAAINILLKKGDIYKKIVQRCNDHLHYNYYKNILKNDTQIYNPNRLKELDLFLEDVNAIFIKHLSQIFYLKDHYMMSSDHQDNLDLGLQPEVGSQYLVAPFIQDIFHTVMTKRMDIVNTIKQKSSMELE